VGITSLRSLPGSKRIDIQIAEGSSPIFRHTGDGIIYEIYQSCNVPFPLVERSFTVGSQGYLRRCQRIVDEDNLEAVLTWITADKVEQVDNRIKDRLREHILYAIRRRGTSLEEHERETITQLPMFKECIPCENEAGVPYR
jgi:hypothetical protein